MSVISLETIKLKKEKILNKFKELKMKINKKIQFQYDELTESTQSYDKYMSSWSNTIDEYNNDIKKSREKVSDLELEKGMIQGLIKEKEEGINSSYSKLKQLQTDINNIDYMLQKENNNLSRAINEKENSDSNEAVLLKELNFLLKTYKSFSCFQFEKTVDGYFKIMFKTIIKSDKMAYITLSVANAKYKVIDCFPAISTQKHNEELEKTHNLTLFLVNLLKEFNNITTK